MKKVVALVLSMLVCAAIHAQSALYPFPASWSYEAVASYSQPRISFASSLPSVSLASAGDLIFIIEDGSPILYRSDGAEWQAVAGGGDASGTASPPAWMTTATEAYSVPQYVASEDAWISRPLIGFGYSDPLAATCPAYIDTTTGAFFVLAASTTASFTWVQVTVPASITVTTPTVRESLATPTSPATGTLWMDGNVSPKRLKFWNGTAWTAL